MTEEKQRAPFEVLEEAILSRRCTAAKVLTYKAITAIDLDRHTEEQVTPVKVMEMPQGANAVCGRGLDHKNMALYTGRRYVVEVLPIMVETHSAPDYLEQLVHLTLLQVDALFFAMLGYLQENRHPPADHSSEAGTVLIVGKSVTGAEELITRNIPLASTNGSLLCLGHPTVIRTATGWQMTSYIGVGVYATW
jgi:hypothetical protein